MKTMEKQKFMLTLKMSLLRYVLVCVFLAFVNWVATPSYWWVLWVIAGWGLGLSLNLINQYLELKLKKE